MGAAAGRIFDIQALPCDAGGLWFVIHCHIQLLQRGYRPVLIQENPCFADHGVGFIGLFGIQRKLRSHPGKTDGAHSQIRKMIHLILAVSDQKFFFDLDCDGEEEEISSLQAGSGFLALDLNGMLFICAERSSRFALSLSPSSPAFFSPVPS